MFNGNGGGDGGGGGDRVDRNWWGNFNIGFHSMLWCILVCTLVCIIVCSQSEGGWITAVWKKLETLIETLKHSEND